MNFQIDGQAIEVDSFYEGDILKDVIRMKRDSKGNTTQEIVINISEIKTISFDFQLEAGSSSILNIKTTLTDRK